MHFLQLLVIGAVLCANVYFGWTPNGYLASIMGIGAAMGVTAAIYALRSRFDARRRLRA